MQAFHDVRFPPAISFGATGGPERRNEIVALSSGREKRNLRTAHSRRFYDAGTGVRALSQLYEIVSFFEARRGSFHGFRFRDPFDMKSCAPEAQPSPVDQFLGTGDGERTTFQLIKWYGDGDDAHAREITKPVVDTVRVSVGGAELVASEEFSIDHATGTMTLETPPDEGDEVHAGYEFDVPVRFDAERIEVSLSAFNAGQIPSIKLVEILLP